MNGGGLFEDAPLPVGEVSMPAPVEAEKPDGIVAYIQVYHTNFYVPMYKRQYYDKV